MNYTTERTPWTRKDKFSLAGLILCFASLFVAGGLVLAYNHAYPQTSQQQIINSNGTWNCKTIKYQHPMYVDIFGKSGVQPVDKFEAKSAFVCGYQYTGTGTTTVFTKIDGQIMYQYETNDYLVSSTPIKIEG